MNASSMTVVNLVRTYNNSADVIDHIPNLEQVVNFTFPPQSFLSNNTTNHSHVGYRRARR